MDVEPLCIPLHPAATLLGRSKEKREDWAVICQQCERRTVHATILERNDTPLHEDLPQQEPGLGGYLLRGVDHPGVVTELQHAQHRRENAVGQEESETLG